MRFLDVLDERFKISSTGLISHPLIWQRGFLKKCKKKAFGLYKRLRYISKTPKYKEAGYHAFNLYALAMLKKRFPEHSFWQTSKFKRTLEYINLDEFVTLLQNSDHRSDLYLLNVHSNSPTCNRYGYPYNPVGFEIAFALKVFFESSAAIDSQMLVWISSQFEHTFDYESGMFSRNTEDPVTLAARIYEATRLPNLDIDISPKN